MDFDEEAEIFSAQWIKYQDGSKIRYAQPDIFVVTPERVYLFEVKLTQTTNAIQQMSELYAPLLRELLQRPVILCAVFRNARDLTVSRVKKISELKSVEYPYPARSWHLLI